jgi:putative tricarboxylic transport membrane protein
MAEKTDDRAGKLKNKRREIIGIAVWLLIAVFVMISSWNLGLGEYKNPGPGFFPFWSALLLGVLSLLMIGTIYFKKDVVAIGGKADLWKDLNWGKNTVIIAALFAYCLVLPKLGYLISTMALMMVLFYMGRMKPWALIAGSMLAVLLSYCLFLYGLKTPLPRGILVF